MNKPLVSIWMVTYNQESFISQAIQSVMMQKTDFDFHLFIGEDCSTDKTGAICMEFKKLYPEKITLIQNKKNLGPTQNAIQIYDLCFKSTSKYMALIEGDDYWIDPYKLQKQVDFLEENEDVNICFTRSNTLSKGQEELHSIPSPFEEKPFQYIELLTHYNFITTVSVVVRKPENFTMPSWFETITFGDLGLYKLIAKDKNIKCINTVMSVYRLHNNGIWSGLNVLESHFNYLNFYKVIFNTLNKNEKDVVKQKANKIIYDISKMRFKKVLLIQKAYFYILKIKYNIFL